MSFNARDHIKCSVVMPVYNSAKYLEKAVTSVLKQSCAGFELIIVDDASADGSRDIIRNFARKDQRIVAIYQKENLGSAECRNLAIANAGGEYIAFLDSDDFWEPNKIELQLAYMEKTGADLCCTAYTMVDDAGNTIKKRTVGHGKILFPDLLKENYICISTVMLRTAMAKEYSMDGSYMHEDYVYWLELIRNGAKGCVFNRNLTCYRLTKTSRSANKMNAAKGRWDVYRSFLGYGILKSAWYFGQYTLNGMRKYQGCDY